MMAVMMMMGTMITVGMRQEGEREKEEKRKEVRRRQLNSYYACMGI